MTDSQRLPSREGSPVNDHDHPSRPADEIALEHMPEKADSTSLASPPADPPPDSMGSSPPYYLPNSAREMFLAYPPPLALGEEKKQRMKFEKKGQPSELEEGESGEEEGGKEDVENSRNSRRAALNRRQTRLYRTLVWVQFSLNVFSCIFILAILILVAIILVMLQRTIDRADHAIRDNPVSQMYSKLKSAVNKINIS